MSGFKKTWLIAWGSGLSYLWLKAAADSWVGFAQDITNVIESVASETINVLESSFSEIGNLAPVSQHFIDELSGVLMNTSLVDLGIATGIGIWAWWVWKKGSQLLWKITWVESEHDNNVSKLWIGAAWALWVLGASASAITIWSGTAWYVIGRKLGEKILGEKYAKITGIIGAVWGAGIAFWASSWTVLWLSAAALWAGFVWKWLWVSENWKKQNTRRKNEWFMKKS